MTIDKVQLKALAEASLVGDWYESGDLRYEDRKTGDVHGLHHDDDRFIAAASPATVVALLAEIEQLAFEPAKHSRRLIDQLKAENEDYKSGQERYEQIIDDLKAENEALRKQIADLWPLKNVPPQDFRASNKCLACGDYHHGLGNLPCPRCTPVAQSAMAKEVPHG